MSALTFIGVRKTFGTTVALEHLDLEVREGELVSLLGPSGCGKTTALRVGAGFEIPDAGSVAVNGRDITRTPAHKRDMGMVFQSYSLFPNLTVSANVEYGLRTRRVERRQRRRRVAEMLELVELGALGDRYPHQLSGGQQQRVALARALAARPQVLLLDEPLSALDARVRASLRDEIRRIQTEVGITTLFVTHDQEEALGLSDRVGVMSNGRLEQLASPVEVYRDPATPFVARFVGSMNELPGVAAGPAEAEVAGVVLAVPRLGGLSRGSRVVILVRPEDLVVETADTGGITGTVVTFTFQGATTSIAVRIDRLDRLVTATMPSSSAPQVHPGQRVRVGVDATRAVCEPVLPPRVEDSVDAQP